MEKKKESFIEKATKVITGNNDTAEVDVVDQPVKTKRVDKQNKVLEDGWELKDRIYRLKGNKNPLSRSVRSANIHWFDEEKGYERELKYTSNQRTPFVDEMTGDQRMEHIIFRNGMLIVEREKVILQKLLSMYHPDLDKLFYGKTSS